MDNATLSRLQEMLVVEENKDQLQNAFLEIGRLYENHSIQFDLAYVMIDNLLQNMFSKGIILQLQTLDSSSSIDYLQQIVTIIQQYQTILFNVFSNPLFQHGEWGSFKQTVGSKMVTYLTPIITSSFLQHFENVCITEIECVLHDQEIHHTVLSSLLTLIASDLLQQHLYQITQSHQCPTYPPPARISHWLQSILPPSVHSTIPPFMTTLEINYFVTHFLQIVEDFPASVQSIHFNNLHHPITLQHETYSKEVKSVISRMQGNAAHLIEYYLKMVRVCWHVSLSSTLTDFLLQPLQHAICEQPDWICSLFLGITRDHSEMLTNPAPSVDWNDNWSIERLLKHTEQTSKSLDLFQSMIQIAGSTEAFVTECSKFFMQRFLFHTEETEEVKAYACLGFLNRMEKLSLFVIRRLRRDAAAKLIGMLRDVRMTRLFNQAYHAKSVQEGVSGYTCSILSRSCWPLEIENTMIRPPPAILSQQRRIEKFFTKGYKNQHLKVLGDEGLVDLSITLRGKTRSITCSIKEYTVLAELSKNQCWDISSLLNVINMPITLIMKTLHSLQKKGLVICVSANPPLYRHVNYWNEKGIESSDEEIHKNEVLEQLKKFERFVIDILNVSTDFDIHQLHRRLTLFLQGVNKFTYSEDELKILIEDMKSRNIVYEEDSILKLRNYFG